MTSSSFVTVATSIPEMLETVKIDGVAFGLNLDKHATQKIYQFAIKNQCMEPNYPFPFLIDDLGEGGKLSTGHIPIRALVKDPLDCLIIRELANDQILLTLAQNYLGYFPNRISCHLTWSLATSLSSDQVEKCYPPATFHYDIAGYNFATAYFYITPVVDVESGPHAMFKGSHQKKALKMLLRSARHPVDDLYAYYGPDKMIEILGDAGFGFFQDPSCFHRVRPPIHNNRLLLQLRYS
ncbi:MAG: hypothetical protein F6K30_29730 [Cyanothece sp. SIO2G6]|nr:hypothetical protein [Cyanothece sp. SIO2G6]